MSFDARVLNACPDAIIATTLQGQVSYWSQGATAIFGYASDDAMGRNIIDLIVLPDRRQEEELILGRIPVLGTMTYESLRRRQDGSLLFVDVSCTWLPAAGGDPPCVIYTQKDVTQLKAKRDAKLVEARYGDLLESMPDAIVVVNTSGLIVLATRQAETLFGYARAELQSRPVEDLLPSRFHAAHVGHRAAFVDQPRVRTMGAGLELFGQRHDGTEFPVEISLSPLETDEGTLVMTAIRDITVRKLAEERFKGLLEAAPDAIVIMDRGGRMVLVNSQTETLFGYARAELLDRTIEMLIPQRFRDHHPAHRDQYFLDSKVRPMGVGLELYALRKDGTEFPVEISLSPLHTENDTLVSSVIRDITERKRVEQALTEKNLELVSANKAKDRFLANMSHELRTPLNAIIGFTGTLLMKLPGPLTPDQDKQRRTVQSSARHLLALINDILDLSKVEVGKMEVFPEPFGIAKVVNEVCAVIASLARAKGIDIALTLDPTVDQVTLDRQKVKQSLFNLMTNAVKFSEAGGHIEVTADAEGTDRIRLQVRDTGIGIATHDLDKLFVEFQQLESGASRRIEGTGLGLVLTRKFVELQGGSVAVESTPGRGSVFTIVLPRHLEPATE